MHQLYVAAMVDDRRRAFTEDARHFRMAKRAAQTQRPLVGERQRSSRWRFLLPHLRFTVPAGSA